MDNTSIPHEVVAYDMLLLEVNRFIDIYQKFPGEFSAITLPPKQFESDTRPFVVEVRERLDAIIQKVELAVPKRGYRLLLKKLAGHANTKHRYGMLLYFIRNVIKLRYADKLKETL